jgi:DNA-binding GntR family transcriptional regulator
MTVLNRNSHVPIYQQITEWMREQIMQGHWPEHYQLKSEIHLAEELNVNRGTLRNAVQTLIDEGLLVRIHGKGTYVTARALEQPLAESLTTFSESLIDQNIPFETRVLQQSVMQPDVGVASLLSLGPNAPVFYLERIRTIQNKPVIYLKNYVAYDYCRGIEKFDFAENRLFELLENEFGQQIAWGRRTFEARIADENIATALAINPGDAVMFVKQIVYLENGSPLEMSDIWINSDNFRVSALVRRDRSNRSLSLISGQAGVMQTELTL